MYCSLLNFESDNSIILKLHGLILNYIFLVISIYQSEKCNISITFSISGFLFINLDTNITA